MIDSGVLVKAYERNVLHVELRRENAKLKAAVRGFLERVERIGEVCVSPGSYTHNEFKELLND